MPADVSRILSPHAQLHHAVRRQFIVFPEFLEARLGTRLAQGMARINVGGPGLQTKHTWHSCLRMTQDWAFIGVHLPVAVAVVVVVLAVVAAAGAAVAAVVVAVAVAVPVVAVQVVAVLVLVVVVGGSSRRRRRSSSSNNNNNSNGSGSSRSTTMKSW